MILGGDTLGRLALGQLDNITETTMTAETAAYVVTVNDADTISEPPQDRRALYLRGRSYWKGRA